MEDAILIALTGIGLMGMVCQWIAWRVKLPAILFLLIIGVILGPLLGWLKPDEIFGQLLMPMVSLAVAVILFEGSLTLKFKEIQGLERVVRRLVTTGVLVTWLTIAIATHWLLNFSWKLSFLFGAITVVTGPTVVVPMLRTVRPTARVSSILRWEGIVIDPIGALLGVLVFQFIISESDADAIGQTLLIFFKTLLLSSMIGAIAGYGFGVLIRNHWLPEYLHNLFALGLVFVVFTTANFVEHESGLLAVTVMGICLANMQRVPMDDILNFKESLSILLISGLFIILAARANFDLFLSLGWSAACVFLVIQFIARPLKVFLATRGTALSWQEKTLIGWIAPRGIVAAATAAVFALRLQEHGVAVNPVSIGHTHAVLSDQEYIQAELLVPLTFMVIIGTVVLQSISARILALRLGVGEPEARGILIVSANCLAREMAKILRECGFEVLLADTSWVNIRAARMDGLQTYYGNVVSEHADQHLDLIGMGHLLALSEFPEMNLLACQRYRAEFGRSAIYAIRSDSHESANARSQYLHSEGRLLFGENVNFQSLQAMLNNGARMRKTVLRDQYDFDDFLRDHQHNAVPLCVIDPNGKIEFFTVDKDLNPKTNCTVISLVCPEAISSAVPILDHGSSAG
ncbi:cation:proton antiporter [Methylomonas sp. MgM2]